MIVVQKNICYMLMNFLTKSAASSIVLNETSGTNNCLPIRIIGTSSDFVTSYIFLYSS